MFGTRKIPSSLIWIHPIQKLRCTTTIAFCKSLSFRVTVLTRSLRFQSPVHCIQSSRELDTGTHITSEAPEKEVFRKMFYSEFSLDRAEHLRKNPSELQLLAESSKAELIPWSKSNCLFRKHQNSSEKFIPMTLTPLSDYLPYLDKKIGEIFLGVDPDSKVPFFAGCVEDQSALEEKITIGDWFWFPVRSVGPKISKSDAALVAAVNGLMEFHLSHQFCGKTGLPLVSASGGFSRQLDVEDKIEKRKSTVFPRIDPAVICLVTQGEYCLLGRKPSWRDKNRYSCLAGFLEIGETFEQAVEREMFEESGIKVESGSIRYFGSQPWPFPQSVMIGFRAQSVQSSSGRTGLERLQGDAHSAAVETGVTPAEVDKYLGCSLTKPTPQPEEMEDVRWFHYNFLKENLDEESDVEELAIPGSHAIANKQYLAGWTELSRVLCRIITGWMEEMAGQQKPWLGDLFPEVVIDHGRFKYVLLRLTADEHSKLIVRGLRGRAYHMNILEEFQSEAEILGFTGNITPLGGGRIEHDASKGEIIIYGYSSAYGTALHDITQVLCQRSFPFYDNITICYSGY